MTRSRKAAERKGRLAEALAALLFWLKGYRIVERRCRTPVGEVDLIALRRRRLVFAEVKLRGGTDEAAWSLTPRQQARIARAAEYWLSRKPAYQGHDVAFDVVLMAPWTWPVHMRDAFRI